MAKVVVGMSGGVDSVVAAYLLKKAGYEVIGVMIRTWEHVGLNYFEGMTNTSVQPILINREESNQDYKNVYEVVQNKCCEIDDAKDTADMLGIEFHAFNGVSEFKNKVVKPFVCEYMCARTPNPCVECNRYVKFEKLLYFANVLGADYIATGHYAKKVKLPNGRYTVQKSDAAKKDQTYMLYKLTQEQLERVLFPLGEYDKSQIREIAKEAGIPVAEKKDSQEICFIPDDDYAGFIQKNYKMLTETADDSIDPFKAGDFVGKDGKSLGKHNGLIHYTIGQRKGLGIALGHPVYVCKLNPDLNQVVIGEEEDLMSEKADIRDYNFLSIPDLEVGESINGIVKIRYHHAGEYAEIKKVSDDRLLLTFDKPVKSATPGQSAVFYDENGYVIGGGIIV